MVSGNEMNMIYPFFLLMPDYRTHCVSSKYSRSFENLNQASRSLNGLIQLTRTDLVFSDSALSLCNLILIFVRQSEPGRFTGTEIGPSVHSGSSAELVVQVSSPGKVALCS